MNMNPDVVSLEELDIAAYLDGSLEAGERAAFERLLAGSKEFQQYLSLVRTAMTDSVKPAEGEVPEYLRENALNLYRQKRDAVDAVISLASRILRILRWSPAIGFSYPAQDVATRKDGEKGPSMTVVTKTFDDVIVEIGIERISERRCNFMVGVKDRTTGRPCDNTRAELMANGREYASCPLKHGEALFEDIRPGRYDIVIRQNDRVSGALAIRINGE